MAHFFKKKQLLLDVKKSYKIHFKNDLFEWPLLQVKWLKLNKTDENLKGF